MHQNSSESRSAPRNEDIEHRRSDPKDTMQKNSDSETMTSCTSFPTPICGTEVARE